MPYAAALDGNYFQAFARVHPQHRFPYVSLLALGGVAVLFCFLSLADVIAALVVIRIMLQFLVQAIGVIVLRIRRPDLPRPFRMWLYPLPALLASIGFIFVLVSRTNSLKQVRYALVILITGIAIYLVRAWRNREWPFGRSQSAAAGGTDELTDHGGSDQNTGARRACLRRLANSAWAPLREPLFRSLWIAAVISYTGTWMQNVGAGWLMTQLTMSPLMVSLVHGRHYASGISGDPARGRAGRHGGPAAIPAHHPELDGGGRRSAGRAYALPPGDAVDAAAVHLHARAGRGDERSGLAGHHAGSRVARKIMRPRWR